MAENNKKRVIAYLHTHWDREWYREFEVFRLRLLRVFDNVLELLEKGEIPSPYSHLKEITPQEDIEENYHYDGDMLDLASCQGHQIGFDEYAEYLEGKVSNRPTNPYTRRRIKD